MEVQLYDVMDEKKINRELGYMHMQLFFFDERDFYKVLRTNYENQILFSFLKSHTHTLKIYKKTKIAYSATILMQTKILNVTF